MARKYRQATDQIVLDRLEAGTLRVDTIRARAYVLRGKRWRRLAEYPDSRGRYFYVRLHKGGSRKAVMLHRVVWMAAHMQLVPPGCEIHHKRGRDENGIEHLECLGKAEHYAETYGYPPEWDEVDYVEEF